MKIYEGKLFRNGEYTDTKRWVLYKDFESVEKLLQVYKGLSQGKGDVIKQLEEEVAALNAAMAYWERGPR